MPVLCAHLEYPRENPSLSPFTKGRRTIVQGLLSPFYKGGLRGFFTKVEKECV
jgi:hypothetical protein